MANLHWDVLVSRDDGHKVLRAGYQRGIYDALLPRRAYHRRGSDYGRVNCARYGIHRDAHRHLRMVFPLLGCEKREQE